MIIMSRYEIQRKGPIQFVVGLALNIYYDDVDYED